MSIQHIESSEIFSLATIHNGIAYLRGMTAKEFSGDITQQTELTLASIDAALAKCGTDKSKLLSATIYISDMSTKPAMNRVWMDWLGELNRPARTCVEAGLGENVLVEITVSAAL